MTREPKPLAPPTIKRLLAYATAAGSVAIASAPVEAEVVYTPVHQNVDLNFYLDLNNDGVPDFRIYSYQLSGFAELQVFPLNAGNRMVHHDGRCGQRIYNHPAAALSAGELIGPARDFQPHANCMMYYDSFGYVGPWYNAKDRYLGLAFVVGGKIHYGWARLTFRNIGCYRCILGLVDYAYETIPNKPITAGLELGICYRTGKPWSSCSGQPGVDFVASRRRQPMNKGPKPLCHLLTNRLLAYTAMAGASLAAFTAHADAEVIYTPTRNDIHGNYPLDLNHDGINDFRISSYELSSDGSLGAIPVHPMNKVAKAFGQGCFRGYSAAALPQGVVIGARLEFGNRATCMADYDSGWTGAWTGEIDHYLGFEFYIDGQKHYGWARLSMDPFCPDGCILRIFGYAYETIPGKPIIAGDEGNATSASEDNATLGALAIGAPSINFWRKPANKKGE